MNHWLIVAFACAALAASLPARPNFSGTWEANLEKSKLRGRPVKRLLVRIEHQEPVIVEKILATYANGDPERMTFRFETTGKESQNSIRGAIGRTKAHWEGVELVIESQVRAGERELEFRDHWFLSNDGQTLTMEHRNDAIAGQVSVLEKAAASAAAEFE